MALSYTAKPYENRQKKWSHYVESMVTEVMLLMSGKKLKKVYLINSSLEDWVY